MTLNFGSCCHCLSNTGVKSLRTTLRFVQCWRMEFTVLRMLDILPTESYSQDPHLLPPPVSFLIVFPYDYAVSKSSYLKNKLLKIPPLNSAKLQPFQSPGLKSPNPTQNWSKIRRDFESDLVPRLRSLATQNQTDDDFRRHPTYPSVGRSTRPCPLAHI